MSYLTPEEARARIAPLQQELAQVMASLTTCDRGSEAYKRARKRIISLRDKLRISEQHTGVDVQVVIPAPDLATCTGDDLMRWYRLSGIAIGGHAARMTWTRARAALLGVLYTRRYGPVKIARMRTAYNLPDWKSVTGLFHNDIEEYKEAVETLAKRIELEGLTVEQIVYEQEGQD